MTAVVDPIKNHREEILARVAKGEYLAQIAPDYGRKTGESISVAFRGDPGYAQARILGLEAKLAARERELEDAEPEGVFKADRLLSHARWRAEREARDIWGKGPDVVINTGPTIGEALGGDALALLDKLRTVSVQPPTEPLDSRTDAVMVQRTQPESACDDTDNEGN